MQWKHPDDRTAAVLTARNHIESCHGGADALPLPKTAILFFMHSGMDYFVQNYSCSLLMQKLPRFLQGGPVYRIHDTICFLDGGRGAPQAADTIETLCALGVKNIISVGMFGSFSSQADVGDIVVPDKVFIEEGTSLHYQNSPDYAQPDSYLLKQTVSLLSPKVLPLVSTDAVYRQTFYKENVWREKGAVGVDMETSAIFTVSKYCRQKAVAILMASDKHPETESSPKWEWRMTQDMRYRLFEQAKTAAENLQT